MTSFHRCLATRKPDGLVSGERIGVLTENKAWLAASCLSVWFGKPPCVGRALLSWRTLGRVDAVSPALREELRLLKEDESGDAAGFSMPRCVFYEGQWIRHGDWYPDRLVRLFLRGQARFVGGRVHERLEVDGPVRSLRGDLEHYSFRDVEHHRAKGGRSARQWADDAFEAGKRPGPLVPFLHAGFRWLRAFV